MQLSVDIFVDALPHTPRRTNVNRKQYSSLSWVGWGFRRLMAPRSM